jgi:hypothetical protein
LENSNPYGRVETYLDAGVVVELYNDAGEVTTFRVKNSNRYSIIAAQVKVNGRELTLHRDPMLKWLSKYQPTIVQTSDAV